MDAALQGAAPRSVGEAVNIVTSTLLACYREYPSLVQLWFVGRTETLVELARAFDKMQAEKMWCWMRDQKLIRHDTSQVVVEIAFEAGDRIFDIAFRDSPGGDEELVNEGRRLVAAYLDTYSTTVL